MLGRVWLVIQLCTEQDIPSLLPDEAGNTSVAGCGQWPVGFIKMYYNPPDHPLLPGTPNITFLLTPDHYCTTINNIQAFLIRQTE